MIIAGWYEFDLDRGEGWINYALQLMGCGKSLCLVSFMWGELIGNDVMFISSGIWKWYCG